MTAALALGAGTGLRLGRPSTRRPSPAVAHVPATHAATGGSRSCGSTGKPRRRKSLQLLCLTPAAYSAVLASGRRSRRSTIARRAAKSVVNVDVLDADAFADYSGAAVELTTATIRRGPNLILDDVDMELPQGARAVIVGANGCGKTTLLSAIAGREPVENGELWVGAPTVGWLRQEAVGGSKRTVYEEAVSEMPARTLEAELKAAEARLAEMEGAGADALQQAQQAYSEVWDRWEAIGGGELQRRATEVLNGLGFVKQDYGRPCSQLSGGWQMRVALARALLQEPALLLLDEPTNHMDAAAKRWLASHLANGLSEKVTLLMVTHDRKLLEDITSSHVFEIADKKVIRYECTNIGKWEQLRKQKVAKLGLEVKKLDQQIKDDRAYIQKWGAKTSHAKKAQSLMKGLVRLEADRARLEATMRGLPNADVALGKSKDGIDEKAVADGTLPLAGPAKVRLVLPDPPLMKKPPPGGVLLGLRETDVGYQGESPIISDVWIEVQRCSRVALLGPNGTGKTTLLRTLAGTLEPQAGFRHIGVGELRRSKIGLFTQDLAQDLPDDMTPVDYVLLDAPINVDPQSARAALGSLGLRGEVHMSKIGTLSGGEKARVALAVFVTRPSDVLLLDEPTNHLDGAAVTALCEGLRKHAESGGAVVVASHDKAFVEALQVTHTASVSRGGATRSGSLEVIEGNPEDSDRPSPFADKANGGANPVTEREVEAEFQKDSKSKTKHQKQVTMNTTAARGKSKNLKKRAELLMVKIEKLEEEAEEFQQEMFQAWTQEKQDKYDQMQKDLQDQYEKWEELVEQADLVLLEAGLDV